MLRHTRIAAILTAAILCLVLASAATAKPMLISGGDSGAGTPVTPPPTPALQAPANTSDSNGLSTLAIVLIATGAALSAGTLGALAGRHSRAGVPST